MNNPPMDDLLGSAVPLTENPQTQAPVESDTPEVRGDLRRRTVPSDRVRFVLQMYLLIIATGVLAPQLMLLGIDGVASPKGASSPILTVMMIQSFIQTAIVISACVYCWPPGFHWFLPKFNRPAKWGLACVIAAILTIVNPGYNLAISTALGLKADPTLGANLQSTTMLVQILLIVVQPAIIEELFFRELVLGNLHLQFKPGMAILLSSLMFAVCHVGMPIMWPPLFLMGIAYAGIRLMTGNILLPIVFHAANNGFALAMIWISNT